MRVGVNQHCSPTSIDASAALHPTTRWTSEQSGARGCSRQRYETRDHTHSVCACVRVSVCPCARVTHLDLLVEKSLHHLCMLDICYGHSTSELLPQLPSKNARSPDLRICSAPPCRSMPPCRWVVVHGYWQSSSTARVWLYLGSARLARLGLAGPCRCTVWSGRSRVGRSSRSQHKLNPCRGVLPGSMHNYSPFRVSTPNQHVTSGPITAQSLQSLR